MSILFKTTVSDSIQTPSAMIFKRLVSLHL